MSLKQLEISGFKSFAKKCDFEFTSPITAIVGPNGSGKSNVAEAFRFVLGEQSIKSLRGKKGEDLIFNGEGSRLNRAAVKVVFENGAQQTPDGEVRLLPVDYDEVSIERAVFRDGTNEYLINGSRVRLKDVTELLAAANIGSSGHHIISQGEADRVLSATPKERRAMIEDALGLRLFQYKKTESQKKLEKTRENKAQVESLRRENGPHLKFLERQVAKIERSRALRDELSGVYKSYLKREERYLMLEEDAIQAAKEEPQASLTRLSLRITQIRTALEQEDGGERSAKEATLTLERELSQVREEASRIARELGSVEGQIAFEERRIAGEKRKQESVDQREVSVGVVTELADTVDGSLAQIEQIDELGLIRKGLADTREHVRTFRARVLTTETATIDESELVRLRGKKQELEGRLQASHAKQESLETTYRTQQESLEREKDENREAERELFTLMQQHNDVRVALAQLTARTDRLERDRDEFKRELAEAAALMGREVLGYRDHEIIGENGAVVPLDELFEEDRAKQEARRRDLERMKIRLEELGGSNVEEVLREYEEVKERDAFLEREIEDLEKSAQSLEELITSLTVELESRFAGGIERISAAFAEFFTTMFGGGKASLALVREKKRKRITDLLGLGPADEMPEEEEEDEDEAFGETGIEVNVALPNKKVKGLMMLSGGERALTSIALIFAMSRVNPPPFLILDETDAALDEANSRRYSDMIETLAKQSQLIVITHNRETMSRAGIMYGVTMGGDGISKLLSVKFEEGVQFAK